MVKSGAQARLLLHSLIHDISENEIVPLPSLDANKNKLRGALTIINFRFSQHLHLIAVHHHTEIDYTLY